MKSVNFLKAHLVVVSACCLAPCQTGFAKSVEDKVKGFIDDASESLKEGVDKLGDDLAAVQNYLDNYHWKGIIQEKASSGPVTLKHLRLNGHAKACVVKPGERIEGVVKCNFDSSQCKSTCMYRVVIGLKGVGAQDTIGNEPGLFAGKKEEKFTLIAPKDPGMYQLRFRLVDNLFKGSALDAWADAQGNEPDGTTTIGIIIVKE